MTFFIEFVFNHQIQNEISVNEEIDLMMHNNQMNDYITDLINEYKDKGAVKYRSVTIYRDVDTDDLLNSVTGTWIVY